MVSPGERALKEVAQMLLESQKTREQLRNDGWERVTSPPLVNNEWLWKHANILKIGTNFM